MPDYKMTASGKAIAPEQPEYPAEWNGDQRTTAYWHALRNNIEVRSTSHWRMVLNDALNDAERKHAKAKRVIAEAAQAKRQQADQRVDLDALGEEPPR